MIAPSVTLLRTQSDERLVALAGTGHERAFEAIVERYRRPLLRHCRRLLPEARAEDALQQALISAWTALNRGDEVHNLRAWLHRIVHNTALNSLRVSGYDYDELRETLEGVGGPAELAERRALVRHTFAGLAALPERQREALLAIAVEGRSQEEVAEELGMSSGAVRQLVHRARTSLRAAATAVTPVPLVHWLADTNRGSEPIASRIAELVAGGATAGAGVTLAKAGAVAVLAGSAVSAPIVVDRVTDSPPARVAAAAPSGGGNGGAPGARSAPATVAAATSAGSSDGSGGGQGRGQGRGRGQGGDDGGQGRGRGRGRGRGGASGSAATGSAGLSAEAVADDGGQGRGRGRGRGGDDTASEGSSSDDSSGSGRGRGRGRGGDDTASEDSSSDDSSGSGRGRGRGRGGDDTASSGESSDSESGRGRGRGRGGASSPPNDDSADDASGGDSSGSGDSSSGGDDSSSGGDDSSSGGDDSPSRIGGDSSGGDSSGGDSSGGDSSGGDSPGGGSSGSSGGGDVPSSASTAGEAAAMAVPPVATPAATPDAD